MVEEGKILPSRAVEQLHLLRHQADALAQLSHAGLPHVDSIEQHAARRRVVEPEEQARERRLAAAGPAQHAQRLARARA